ncbi:MAG: hypothetical protein K2X04_08085, partial [Burkholderiales bacterium]|nr:hypothetical protein [Burkholderiales bacterium]
MITTDFQYKTLAAANKKIVDLQDKLSKQLKINEGLVLENRQLKAQVAQLSKKVSELESVVNKQSEIIDKLMRKLGLNSDNSSVPPSKNGLNKKPRSGNSREKSDKKSGGQVGHKGTTLEFSAHADEEIEHKPTKCSGCGAILSSGYEHIETRQVQDVLIQKIISNHLIFAAKCNCGCIEKANPSIACGVSYGAGLKSI